MPEISMPPVIPLPNAPRNNGNDPKEDLFATLFSPATPRSSPAVSPPLEEGERTKPIHRHIRSSSSTSTDSEFGSFVSVPSTEDPLAQFVSASTSVPFTPVQNFEFFESSKAKQGVGGKDLLEELLENENDPLHFLRSAAPATVQARSGFLEGPMSGGSTPGWSRGSSEHDASVDGERPLVSLGSSLNTGRDHAGGDLLSEEPPDLDWRHASGSIERARPPLLTPSPPASSHGMPSVTSLAPQNSLLKELLDHQDDPMYFSTMTGVEASRTPTPQPSTKEGLLIDLDTFYEEPDQRSRPFMRYPQKTAPAPSVKLSSSPSHSPVRSPSLPPTPMRMSQPEVQRTQSYFMPSSLSAASAFPTRWVSSLLSRPAPPPPPPTEPPSTASILSSVPLTHGTPFAAHPYIPPSGAPGFAGDRTWDKGFQYDRENVERASVRLLGRRESTTPILTIAIADKIRPNLPPLKRIPKSWTLLYSLDQHGISLNTLYTRCEAHTSGALILMKDSNEVVFGAWIGDGIRPSRGAFYGSGESFLWKLTTDEKLRVFKWSGKNEYVALCETEYISFGGGDGHYGLYLDETLSDGSSARCSTFDNEPLCSAGPRQGEAVTFQCVGLEVWGVN